MKKWIFLTLVIFLLAMTLGACAPAATEAAPAEPAAEEAPAEPTKAPEPTKEPEPVVEEPPALDLAGTTVVFWHVYGQGTPSEQMNAMVDEFNKTNEWGITVEAFDQGQYGDVEDKMNAAIQSGDLPDLVMAYTNALADWYSVDAIADISSLVYDPEIGLTDEEIAAIYPSALEAGMMPDGSMVAFPMTQSANVLVYNFTWAKELGFDAPPATSAELKEQICAASAANAADDNPDNDGTGGMVYYPSNTNWLNFLYAFGGSEVSGDAYDFNTEEALAASLYLNDLRDAGCVFQTESYPNPEQAQRKALITLSSTAGLPYYTAAFEDAANEDEWGFIGAPGPDGKLAVDAFQQMMGIVHTTPEKMQAAWLFMRWFTSAEQQAAWIRVSGYLPTQSTTLDLLADYAAENPVWQQGAQLAALGPAEPQTFPAWSGVRRAIGDSAAVLYAATDEAAVKAELEALTAKAAELVVEVQ